MLIILTLSSFVESIKSIDTSVVLWINGHNSPALDAIMMAASDTYTWIPLYAMMAFLLVKKYGKASWLPIIFVVLAIVISDQCSVHFAKDIFMRYRPTHNLLLQDQLHIVDDYRGGLYGFVSSHAANTVSFTTIILSLLRKKYIAAVLFFYILIVCYSRMYLGVHYPTDILGGMILGFIAGSLAYWLYRLADKAINDRQAAQN